MLDVALLETVHTVAHGQQQQRGPWLVLDAQVAVAAGRIPHHSCCVSCGVDFMLGRDLLALHNLVHQAFCRTGTRACLCLYMLSYAFV